MKSLLLLLALLAHDHAGRPCRWRMDRPVGEGIKIRYHVAERLTLPSSSATDGNLTGIDGNSAGVFPPQINSANKIGICSQAPLGRDEVRAAARLAWSDWAAVAGVEAVEVATIGEANVEVRAARVDGPGGEVGRAAYPCQAGRDNRVHVRLDRSDRWDAATVRRVLRHEAGHVLGISDDGPGSWMAERVDWMGDLPSWWDRAEAQARYGPPLPEINAGDNPGGFGAYLGTMPFFRPPGLPDRPRLIRWRVVTGAATGFGGVHLLRAGRGKA